MRIIPFSPPDITGTEINAVISTLQSGWITTGEKTKLFEKNIAKYIGTNRVACFSSQTAAAEMTLRILGIGPGDEVIVPAYTYTASASVIDHVGAKIVMVDVACGSYEIDYDAIADAITPKTKVIIPVDIGGVMCDYDKIYTALYSRKKLFRVNNELQALYNRIIIAADSAHGFGAMRNGKKSGQVADFTTFSFHAVKNLTTGEGGAVTWRDLSGLDNNWLYNQFMMISLHGQSKDALEKQKVGTWEYDILTPAYKCNMTDITASLGLIQLERYTWLLKRRHEIIKKYNNDFNPLGIQILQHESDHFKSSGHLYLTRIPGIYAEERNNIIKKMAESGVICNVHYKPLPMMTAYRRLGFTIGNYPNAYKQYENVITLPLYTKLTEEDVEFVIDNYIESIKKYLY